MDDNEPGMIGESVSEASAAGEADGNLRNMGAAIAICAALILFGGSTFALWTLEFDVEGFTTVEIEFGAREAGTDVTVMGMSESETIAYSDSDCECDAMNSFSTLVSVMVAVLLIFGVALGYMGHSGEKMEFAPKVIVGAALISVIILLYTFMSLPQAFEDDESDDEEEGFFEIFDEDPAFFSDHEISNDGVSGSLKTTAGMGFFLPIVTLGLCGYLIRDRGITLEDITG